MKIIKYNKDNRGSESEELLCENISKSYGELVVNLLNGIEKSKPREIDFEDTFTGEVFYENRYRFSLEEDWYRVQEVYV